MITIRKNDFVRNATQINRFTILFFSKGKGDIQINLNRYRLEKSITIIIPPYYYCQLQDLGSNYISIDFDINDIHFKNKLRLYTTIYKLNLFRTFNVTQYHFFDSIQHADIDIILSSMLDNIADNYLFKNNTDIFIHAYKYANEFYMQLLSKDINYSQLLAQTFCDSHEISVRTLNRACKAIFGMSSNIIIKKTLTNKAINTLLESRMSIQEVSYRMGFSEATNFCRYMKKHTGYTPKEIRSYVYNVKN